MEKHGVRGSEKMELDVGKLCEGKFRCLFREMAGPDNGPCHAIRGDSGSVGWQ